MKFMYLFIVIFFITASVLSNQVIFGDEYGTLSWKLIFASSFDDCKSYQWTALSNYLSIVKQYLILYKIDNKFTSPSCINVNDLSDVVFTARLSNDLIVIIPDHFENKKSIRQSLEQKCRVWNFPAFLLKVAFGSSL